MYIPMPMLTVTVFSIAAGLVRLPRSRAARLHADRLPTDAVHINFQLPRTLRIPYWPKARPPVHTSGSRMAVEACG